MKKVSLLALFAVFAMYAFKGEDFKDPEFVNQPYFIKKDGSYLKLEKQVSENKVKAKGMGYGGVSHFYNLDEGHSPVRINEAKPTFVVKLEKEGLDPETIWVLVKCKGNGKHREIEIAHTSAFAGYGAAGKSVKKDYVKLDFQKMNGSTFKMVVTEPLESGEYSFYAATDQGGQGGSRVPIFSFGKD